MNKICLFALLIAVASANLATDISNIMTPTREYMSCLSKNVTKVILKISDKQGTINKNFLNGFIFAKDAGISTVDATVVVNDTLVPSELSADVTAALPANFNGTVWLQVLNAPTLWDRQMSQRISYLEDLVLAFQQHNLTTGIYSDANAWTSILGSPGIGSETLDSALVWYANNNGIQSFDDFNYAGFGTWTKPSLKNYKNYVPICYIVTTSFDYYEAETQFKKIDQQRFLSY